MASAASALAAIFGCIALGAMSKAGGSGAPAAIFARFAAAIGPRAGLPPVNLALGIGRPGGSGALAAMSKAGGSGALAAIFGRFAAAIGPRAGLPPEMTIGPRAGLPPA